MKGTYLKISTDSTCTITTVEDEPPTLDKLKEKIDGGLLEVVPQFTRIEFRGKIMRCVTFCDEEGKNKNLPVNMLATHLWEKSLQSIGFGLRRPDGTMRDVLVGSVLVVFGDKRFMEAL
jgi:hypothetical protein